MIDLGPELKTHLKSFSAITDLIGTGTSARIYEIDIVRQKNTPILPPYIVYKVFEGVSHTHLNGISGIDRNRVEIKSYGDNRANAFTLARLVNGYLQQYRGPFGSIFAHIITSDNTFIHGRDIPVVGGNIRRHYFERDYMITYTNDNAYVDGIYGPAYADQYG